MSRPRPVEDLHMRPPASGVTVRMYRTGLGDCFLLCFPAGADEGAPRPFFMLIDCGVYRQTPGGRDRMRKIAENIRRATRREIDGSARSRIDLLVITHEHWDHVSAFHEKQARDIFSDIEIGEVWLPWTEDPDEPLSLELRDIKDATMRGLHRAYREMLKRKQDDETSRRVKTTLHMMGLDGGTAAAPPEFDRKDGAGTALAWIRDEACASVRFRSPGPEPGDDGTLPGLSGVRFYVLGPPKDDDLIHRLDPNDRLDEAYSRTRGMAKAMAGAYFAVFGAMPGEGIPDGDEDQSRILADERRRRSRPFEDVHRIELKAARRANSFFRKTYYAPDQDWRTIETDWLAAAGRFALNVDGLANNSSLVLAIELVDSGRVLLFAADAQVGNWLSWFGKVRYRDGQERGRDMVWTLADGRTVDAEDLLARTVLYKVGHHGSHNATLKKRGLEIMGTRWPREFTAMLPVDENIARNHTTYGEMPLTQLVAALLERTEGRLLRTDHDAEPEATRRHAHLEPTQAGVGGRKPLPIGEFPRCKPDESKDGLYFDYTVE